VGAVSPARVWRSPLALFALLALTASCRGDSPESPAQEAPSEPRHAERHAHEREHGGPHEHRFADPARFVEAWNAPERDAWQKPEEIVAALRLEPSATVVDLGAGTGYLVPKLARAVGPSGTVLAADVEPAMLEFLANAAEKEGWTNVRTHALSPDDPELEPGSVDAIVALNVWHHIGDREAYARKLRAALRPGGVFVVVDFLKEETEGFGPPLHMRLTAEEVKRELEAGGLSAEIVDETLPRHYIVRGAAAASEVEVRALEPNGPGERWGAHMGACELTLSVDRGRLWWSASPIDPSGDARCEVLAPAHRPAFVALADAARGALIQGAPLSLVIDFHAEPASIEHWFRAQARSEALQALAAGRHDATYNGLLGEHMLRSGSLARYVELLEAMGLEIEEVSLEKVELRPARHWTRDLPESAAWDLPPDAQLALPFLTWLRLRSR
jgi:SAM-dependent methyltransferase